MPENQEVRHYQVNGKYKLKLMRAAGVKTGDGFEVEVNGDNFMDTLGDANKLYQEAKKLTFVPLTESKTPPAEK